MITKFKGEYRYLSNFYPDAPILYRGKIYPTSEHLFQALKTLDPTAHESVRLAKSPGEAKRLGQKVPIRKSWNGIRIAVMGYVVLLKFNQHPELQARLLSTGEQDLVEGNTWGDTFWGVCRGVGTNHLGKILVDLRKYYRDLTLGE